MLQRFEPNTAARVLVAGDVILDRYVHGVSERISPEAPVPVVRVTGSEERPGGAANVAMNIRSLGVAVQLTGITGADDAAAALQRILTAAGVRCRFVAREGAATITKVRVISQHQQLLRLDHESDPGATDALVQQYVQLLAGSTVVVLSDYAKGALAEVGAMIAAATAQRIPVLVDPKGTDFSRYRGATLLTPNQREFEAVAGRWRDESDLEARARSLCAHLGLAALLVTRGERGMTLIEAQRRDALQLAARAHEVFDVTGAGDTVIGVIAAALASGYPLPQAVEYANVAAGKVVEKLGTATVALDELNAALAPPGAAHRVVPRAELPDVLARARARGERIVMTNGCFDLLHPGHVGYLEQARALGDRLLVAVNSDASVARLKGPGRPVSPLASRMRLLSALACVDWVTPFDEDTPAALIGTVRPDVLVKGGDYTPAQVAGADIVLGYGGRVEILPFQGGHSSSALMAAIATRSGK
jgi:D-beta-D-heptose 7-phosphate kinase/D-beta-D-heptose 1-phosphate adenosyltransferase